MDESVIHLWSAYCAMSEADPAATPPPAWHFCDNPADADECAQLVLSGAKRATAPSLWGFEVRGEPLPAIGSLDIVTTWDGKACALIRTTQVDIVPFDSVDAAFAAAEGEGDGSLEYWRRVHWAYYARELEGSRFVSVAEMPVVCQQFEVIYRFDE